MSSNIIVTFILSYFKLVFFIVNVYRFILSLFTSSKMIFYMNPFCHIMNTALPLLKGLSFDGFPRTIG